MDVVLFHDLYFLLSFSCFCSECFLLLHKRQFSELLPPSALPHSPVPLSGTSLLYQLVNIPLVSMFLLLFPHLCSVQSAIFTGISLPHAHELKQMKNICCSAQRWELISWALIRFIFSILICFGWWASFIRYFYDAQHRDTHSLIRSSKVLLEYKQVINAALILYHKEPFLKCIKAVKDLQSKPSTFMQVYYR